MIKQGGNDEKVLLWENGSVIIPPSRVCSQAAITVAPHAGLPTNACSTENNIPFPLLLSPDVALAVLASTTATAAKTSLLK